MTSSQFPEDCDSLLKFLWSFLFSLFISSVKLHRAQPHKSQENRERAVHGGTMPGTCLMEAAGQARVMWFSELEAETQNMPFQPCSHGGHPVFCACSLPASPGPCTSAKKTAGRQMCEQQLAPSSYQRQEFPWVLPHVRSLYRNGAAKLRSCFLDRIFLSRALFEDKLLSCVLE